MVHNKKLPPKKLLSIVFLSALILRLLLLWISSFHPQGFLYPDSHIYLQIAEGIMETGEYVHKSGGIYYPETERTPFYPLYLSMFFTIFGNSIIWPLIGQAIFGSITCVVIGLISREFYEGSFSIAGILAAVNLNLISYQAVIMTETLFLFFFTCHLYYFLRLIKEPSYGLAIFSGLWLGISAMTRSVSIYWCPLIAMYLTILLIFRRWGLVNAVTCGALIILGSSMITAPLYLKNYNDYGFFELVSQKGNLAHWIVPLVWEINTGLPFGDGIVRMDKIIKSEFKKHDLHIFPKTMSVKNFGTTIFKRSEIMKEIGLSELKKLSLWKVAYAWITGAAINLMTPSMASLSLIDKMKRPRFYKTEGNNIFLKTKNFLFHPDNSLYLNLMIPSILIILLGRILILIGLIQLLYDKNKRSVNIVLVLVLGYFFAVTGPIVGAARYRIPYEPILITLTAIGLIYIHSLWKRR